MNSRFSAHCAFILAFLVVVALQGGCLTSAPLHVSFSQSAPSIEAYDDLEVTANISWPHARNPFTDASFTGWFESADGSNRAHAEGFCDSDDGSIFRIRFMPSAPGEYRYSVEYRQGRRSSVSTGTFQATEGHRRGPIRVDPQHRWHFIWEGTGEHYFFNGTTAFWLMGWADEKVIRDSIQRFHDLEVNRIRVTIAGRTDLLYGEPIMTGPNWTTFVTAWPAKQGDDIYHPGFDYTRFYLPYWQKFDRALRFARDRDMIISLILDMNDSRVHPAEGGEDEQRYIRYAIARFGAYSNITWDLGDDLDRYRSDSWVRHTGDFVEKWDPYHHLATSHPIKDPHQDLTAEWFGFTSFQNWSREQHSYMLTQRERQARTGRIIPQANEEYGYEDHYPLWSDGLGSDSSDTLRRTAWDIVMAGAYQTSGETARRGTNIWPDTGGGWMNGRGDATMTMLKGYSHMVDFFTGFDWWLTEPHDELVNNGNYCLADPGSIYVVYLPHGGRATVHLEKGPYTGTLFNPSTGEKTGLPPANGPIWTSPATPDNSDWAILLEKK